MIHAQAQVTTILMPAQTVTDGVTVTANWDTKGFDYAKIDVNLGLEETTDATAVLVSLLESDDTVVTNFATITANLSPDQITASPISYMVDLKKRKRYLRLAVRAGTGTGSNLTFAAQVTGSRMATGPDTTTDMLVAASGTQVPSVIIV